MKRKPVNDRCCMNPDCPLHGQLGKGNIIRHSFYKTSQGRRRRYLCKACEKSFDRTYQENRRDIGLVLAGYAGSLGMPSHRDSRDDGTGWVDVMKNGLENGKFDPGCVCTARGTESNFLRKKWPKNPVKSREGLNALLPTDNKSRTVLYGGLIS